MGDGVHPSVEHVARKIARMSGVEQSFIGKDGAISAIIEGGYNRTLRSEVLEVGQRAMIPVRVFYRMPDGRAIGEQMAREEMEEDVTDFYDTVHVSGFAGDKPKNPPQDIGGDSYGDRVRIGDSPRDDYGQYRLKRIRSNGRGRPVVGWRYGDNVVQKGTRVNFLKKCCLQWKNGKTLTVNPGAKGVVSGVFTRRPIASVTIGGHEGVELPIHALGHVYDVMTDQKMESLDQFSSPIRRTVELDPDLKRLVNAVGFGRDPRYDETEVNSPKFKGSHQPDVIAYGESEEEGEEEEDFIGDPDERRVVKDEPRVKVRTKSGDKKSKKVLFSKR